MRDARDGADEGSSTGCGLLLVDEMLAAQPVTSKRVAYTVAPIVALPRGLIFMRRIVLPSRSMEQGPIVPCCTTANTRLAASPPVCKEHHSGIMRVILVEVFWVFAVPAIARVRRSSPGSRPSPAGDLRSALTPAAVRRVDEAAGAGKMDGLVGCNVQASLRVVVAGR